MTQVQDVIASFRLANRAPSANAGGPYSAVRNQGIAFDGSGSTDPDGDALTYAWDFGDGTTATGATPTHSYTTLGSFTVTLIVNDGALSSTPATATVTISNQAPVANAGGPYTAVRNQTIAFAGSASNDADGDALTYSWEFGDGATGTGVSPSHAYTTLGSFTVTLTVNDGNTTSAPVTATVTISNQAPAANAGGPYSAVRNQAIAFNGAGSSDPDGDSLTYAWNFGDGATATGVAPSHAYTTLGTFTVTLIVDDGTTTSAPATATVTISNQAPVANAGGPYSSTRLQAIVFDGSGSSDPDGDSLTYEWSFGDGTNGTGVSPSHTYAQLGSFTVTLVVRDGTTASAPATASVTITNVAPSAALTSPAPGSVFTLPAAVPLSAAASDPDGAVSRVEFYAGAVKIGEDLAAPFEMLWSGGGAGSHALTALAIDDNGASVASAPVTVTLNSPPSVALTAPADGAQFAAPAAITLTASASDVDGAVMQVEFFQGATSLGVDTSSPYSVTWNGVAPGVYTLTAVATDNLGASVASVPITVRVTAALTPTADAYVRGGSANANQNFGSATTLTVQQNNSSGSNRWTYVKFDLSSVPSVTSAKLRLFGALSATTSVTVQTAAFSVSNTTWIESGTGGITWNNKPASGSTALATVTMVNNSTTQRWYEWDVTAYLQQEKAAGRNVVTLALKNLANSSPFDRFNSKEATSNRPEVFVVP
jgi:PKD repeat protein